MTDAAPTRRRVLQGAAGLTVAAATQPALAQSAEPEYDGWFDNVGNYEGETVDNRDQDEIEITVGAQGNGGAFAFDSPAVRVSPGTTVVWTWADEPGSHNVVAESGSFESELVSDGGHTFEYTFEESGVYKYACTPHRSMGMKGAVVVGEGGAGSGGDGGSSNESGGSEGAETPDFGDWFGNVGNYEGELVDGTGQSELAATVGADGNGGAFAFDPPAVEVDPGTTVVWEWSGNGGSHNVVAEDGSFESELTDEAGYTFEYTFEESGVYKYACTPHKTVGMKGAIVVAESSGSAGDGGEGASDTGGDGAGDSGGPTVSPSDSAVAISFLLAFLSPLGLAAYLRRQQRSDQAQQTGTPRTGD